MQDRSFVALSGRSRPSDPVRRWVWLILASACTLTGALTIATWHALQHVGEGNNKQSPPHGVVALADADTINVQAGFVSSTPPEKPQARQLQPPKSLASVTPQVSGRPGPMEQMQRLLVDARHELRDPNWSRVTEVTVREALRSGYGNQVEINSLECGSTRCIVEGRIGSLDRTMPNLSRALTEKTGLQRSKIRYSSPPGTPGTFTALVARKGYSLDGSPFQRAAAH